jgi:hypothetical protein
LEVEAISHVAAITVESKRHLVVVVETQTQG